MGSSHDLFYTFFHIVSGLGRQLEEWAVGEIGTCKNLSLLSAHFPEGRINVYQITFVSNLTRMNRIIIIWIITEQENEI